MDISSIVKGSNLRTVVMGKVVEALPKLEVENRVYQDWVVQVERYVLKPLPYERVTVRVWEAVLHEGGFSMPTKDIKLHQDERVILFLNKREGFSLSEDQFTILNPMFGKFLIEDGMVNYPVWAEVAPESIEDFIAEVNAAARD